MYYYDEKTSYHHHRHASRCAVALLVKPPRRPPGSGLCFEEMKLKNESHSREASLYPRSAGPISDVRARFRASSRTSTHRLRFFADDAGVFFPPDPGVLLAPEALLGVLFVGVLFFFALAFTIVKSSLLAS